MLARLIRACAAGLAVTTAMPSPAQFFPRDDPPSHKDCSPALKEDVLVECLVGPMTLTEKANYVGGQGFESNGVKRLRIPPFRMSDGPKGGRTDGYPTTSAFPGGVSLASTWNPDLVGRAAGAMGEEASALGVAVLLGPGVNIQRYPLGGRNFEYYSQDTVLSGSIGAAWVRGLQSRGFAASQKHFAVNNQETNRFRNNSFVDESSLREIYLPQVEQIVREAHPWTVMSSYYRVNGTFASRNRWLGTDVLRKEWGYDGSVVSDWTGLHDTVGGMNAGDDLEMPSAKYYGSRLVDAVQVKSVALETLNESVRRLLTLQIRTGTLKSAKVAIPGSPAIGSTPHLALARAVAEKSLFLLKNESDLLPLRQDMKVAFIGPNVEPTTIRGAGSSEVTAPRRISVRDCVPALRGDALSAFTLRGLNDTAIPAAISGQFLTGNATGETGLMRRYWSNAEFSEELLETRRDTALFAIGPENAYPANALKPRAVSWDGRFSAAYSGEYRFSAVGYGDVRLDIDGKLVLDKGSGHKAATVDFFGYAMPSFEGSVTLTPGLPDFRFECVLLVEPTNAPVNLFRFGVHPPGGTIAEAAAAARKADVALVVVGLSPTAETEVPIARASDCSAIRIRLSRQSWPPIRERSSSSMRVDRS